jgi:tetratricopeptide (TPR) repeat protein
MNYETMNDAIHAAAAAVAHGEEKQSREKCRHLLELIETTNALTPDEQITLRNDVASIMSDLHMFAESEKLYAEALAIAEADTALYQQYGGTLLSNLGALYALKDEPPERIEQIYRQALAVSSKFSGAHSKETAHCQLNLAGALRDQGKYDEAERILRDVLSVREDRLGPAHRDTAYAAYRYADVLLLRGEYVEALHRYQQALDTLRMLFDDNNLEVSHVVYQLSMLYRLVNDWDKALHYLGWHAEAIESQYGPRDPRTRQRWKEFDQLSRQARKAKS